MSSQIADSEEQSSNGSSLLNNARNHVLNGSIGALSIDTCIFTDNGYRLESGILKRLEQFKDNPFVFLLSEVTFREVHKHIVKQAEEDRGKLVGALRSIGKTWLVDPEKQANILSNAIGSASTKSMVSKRLVDFANRTGFELIKAKDTLDVTELLKRYFNVQPPFENTSSKKAEFPDAIALLSLQAWAKENNTKVIFVSKDKGCQRFCLESDQLIPLDDLDDTLALIQERDKHCSELCKNIESAIWSGAFPDLNDRVQAAVSRNIWDIEWLPEASAAFHFDAEIQNIEVLSVALPISISKGTFKVVDFRHGVLVVQSSALVDIEASCIFSFSVRDGIDRDMVGIGHSMVVEKLSVDLNVLISFEKAGSSVPSVTEIELLPSTLTIDFGSVEPDYSNEDPGEEDY